MPASASCSIRGSGQAPSILSSWRFAASSPLRLFFSSVKATASPRPISPRRSNMSPCRGASSGAIFSRERAGRDDDRRGRGDCDRRLLHIAAGQGAGDELRARGYPGATQALAGAACFAPSRHERSKATKRAAVAMSALSAARRSPLRNPRPSARSGNSSSSCEAAKAPSASSRPSISANAMTKRAAGGGCGMQRRQRHRLVAGDRDGEGVQRRRLLGDRDDPRVTASGAS